MSEKQPLISERAREKVHEEEIDLYELFMVFLDHIKLIVICFVVGALAFGSASYFLIAPTYQATAKMYIVSASNDSVVDLTDLNIGSSLTKDYEELIMCDPVVESVIEDLKLDNTPQQVKSMISINNPEDTRVLSITATTTDPKLSQELANTFMDESLEYMPETMSTNPPNVAQRAKLPEQKSGPSNSKNTLIGALLGLILACGWLTIQYIRDDTIHTAEDMETYFGIVPLTSIPESSNLSDPAADDKDVKRGFLKRRKNRTKKAKKEKGGKK